MFSLQKYTTVKSNNFSNLTDWNERISGIIVLEMTNINSSNSVLMD